LTRPLKTTGPGSLTVGRKEQGTFIFTVSPLWSKSEQEKLRYAYTSGRFWTILPETTLVGVMKIQIDGSKLDDRNPNVIALQCMTYRSIPEELPLDVQDTLRVRAKRILGPDMEVISNEIKIPVKSGGKPVAPDLQ
jgi:hypothetical protein